MSIRWFSFKPQDICCLEQKDKNLVFLQELLKKYKEADEELEKYCKENNIEKPELIW